MSTEPESQVKPQNQPATIKDRVIAYIIDVAIIIGVHLFIWPILLTHVSFSGGVFNFPRILDRSTINEIILLILGGFFFSALLYEAAFEFGLKRATPGKTTRNIKITQKDGAEAKFSNYLRFWFLSYMSVLPHGYLFLVALFLAAYEEVPSLSIYGLGLWIPPILWLPICGLIALGMLVSIRRVARWIDRLSGTAVISLKKDALASIADTKSKDKPKAPDQLIANITEASKNARSIYLLYIGLLAYSALTIASTSDRRLILNEPARLPVINLDVPLDGFFILGPILAVFIFIYFQLYLHKLKRLLDDLRSNYRVTNESQEIYPWMLNFFDELGSGFVARTQQFIVNFTLWWSLPAVLMFFALWYLKKHDPFLCSVVSFMPLIGSFIVVAFWTNYQQPTGYKFEITSSAIKSFFTHNKDKTALLGMVLGLEIYLFLVFMPLALRGERILNAWPAVDLSHQTLVNKQDEAFGTVYWVNLRNARLQGADFTGAILQRADLRNANLERAKLQESDLSGADLSRAFLKDADLRSAVLQNAILIEGNLQNASVTGAKLDSADLLLANLRNADLRETNIKNVRNLQSVNFREADLRGADLRGVDLKNGRFYSANLSKANLQSANLKNIYFLNTNLSEADLRNANLEDADLTKAILRGAIFEGTLLTGARLDSADLRWANLSSLKVDSLQIRDARITAEKLRAIPLNELSDDSVKAMLLEKGFFDSNWNSNTAGFPNKFVKHSQNEIIVDSTTQLLWQRAGSDSTKTYNEAQAYIEHLNRDNFAGYNDWRLPTLEEAMSLMEPERKNRNLYIDPMFDSKQTLVWTADHPDASYAWFVGFINGYCSNCHVDYRHYVRAVRSH